MFKVILHLLFWWWPKLPAWFRYGVAGLIVVGAIIAWVMEPEAWPAYVFLMFVGGSAAMYGEPSEAEKRGYRV